MPHQSVAHVPLGSGRAGRHHQRRMSSAPYQIVRLANGTHSIYASAEDETFHPVIGPVEEARALYVNQLNLPARAAAAKEPFVIWDVGLGAAANVLTAFEATRDLACELHVVSFDHTLEPLKFALANQESLTYITPYAKEAAALVEKSEVQFTNGRQNIQWKFQLGDFPTLISTAKRGNPYPAPHAILFDAYSPAKNPVMWTAPLFTAIHRLLDPARPCAMPTYSRSTLLRVTLLLAGFYVGVGHATGEKEETTVAANTLELLSDPLPRSWLKRARFSASAEPMWEPTYRQAPITEESWLKLQAHPQFNA